MMNEIDTKGIRIFYGKYNDLFFVCPQETIDKISGRQEGVFCTTPEAFNHVKDYLLMQEEDPTKLPLWNDGDCGLRQELVEKFSEILNCDKYLVSNAFAIFEMN